MKPSQPVTDDRHQLGQDEKNGNTNRYWGDKISSKKETNNLRVAFQNINGFGANKEAIKHQIIREFIKKNEIDIYAISEVNVNWRITSKKNSINELTRGWFEQQRVAVGYNQKDRSCGNYQPGGVGIITQGEAALRHIKSTQDPKKLGRWISTLYRGKNNKKLRVVSIYCPIHTTQFGNKKVYCQQQRALIQMGISEPTWKVYWEDLWKEVDKWLEDGENLIIGGDWNRDIREKKFLEEFQRRNLKPAVTGKHGNEGPETYNNGSKPIDEIFITPAIEVTASGYLEHGKSVGDHRPIWVEISKESAFGSVLPDLPSFKARKLKCHDPRIVTKYNDILEKYLRDHNFFNRVEKLFTECSEEMNSEQEEEYEKLDSIRERGMLVAENGCRRLKMGSKKWSPTLQRAIDRYRYMKLSISRIKGRKIGARTLIRLSKKCGFNSEGMSVEELIIERDGAFKEYKSIKKKHIELRETFLEELAQAMEDAGNGKKASNIKNMIERERKIEAFKKIKIVTKGSQNLATTFIRTKVDGKIKEISNQEGIEKAIIKENKKKYHQTEGVCPFLREPLRQIFGDYGETDQVQSLLEGRIERINGVDNYTQDFLEVCKLKEGKETTSLERTPLMFKEAWQKAKERTSSRRLHFGHFKASCINPLLLMSHYYMAEVPFKTGYSPLRWQNATNVMILKEEGVYDVEKLRTIVLFEADFNQNNKHLGRSMMQHCVKNNLISEEQYSIPGKKCVDHALNRRLLFDITRYKKTSTAMTPCDLKSCFDRIAHTPATLAMASLGIPRKPIMSMFNTIQETDFITRTVFGDSEECFGGTEKEYDAKPQGVGQGNGAGPQVWSVVSSKMFEVLKKNGIATRMLSPITKDELELAGFAFVDDADIITMSDSNDPKETLKKMQEAINCWEGVAKVTGGALAPQKSWWYLISFKWEKDGSWTYETVDDKTETLMARDKDDNWVKLKNIGVNEAKKMLGVFLAPNGADEKQKQEMITKTTALGDKIRTGNLTKNETWMALNLVAIKGIEYPLPALALNEKDYEEIMRPLWKNYLPKMGMNRNFTRVIMFGPSSRQGLGVRNPYYIQGINRVVVCMEHAWKKTMTGFFIKSCLEQLRLEVGMNIDLFQSNYNKYKGIILTDSWIVDTWRFATEQGISWNDKTQKIGLLREKDECIMDKVMESKISDTEKRQVNRCRVYMQVITLADITTGDGKRIRSEAWAVQKCSRQGITWPEWGTPSTADKNVWRRVIRSIFFPTKHLTLETPLGKWSSDNTEHWEWFISKDEGRLYQNKNNEWKIFDRMGKSRLQGRYKKTGKPVVPNDMKLERTTVKKTHSCYITEGSVGSKLMEKLTRQETCHDWLFTKVYETKEINKVIEDITIGKAIAVSDGSYKNDGNIGAAAWIIESWDKSQYIRGQCIVPGEKRVQSAYRSELVGLLAILEKLRLICLQHKITQGGCTIACDGIAALQEATMGNERWITPRKQHCDILSATNRIIQGMEIEIKPTHVRGHSDDKKKEGFTRLEEMNIRMDLSAKAMTDTIAVSKERWDKFVTHPFSFTMPVIQGRTIVGDTNNKLYQEITEQKLEEYWIRKRRYSKNSSKLIDWKHQEIAHKREKEGIKRFLAKWTTGMIAVGRQMKRWGFRYQDNCPICNDTDEDTLHILSCTHEISMELWEECQWKLIVELHKMDTASTAIMAIIKELNTLKFPDQIPQIEHLDKDLQEAILSQRKIGWKNFLEGLVATDWGKFQGWYYNNKGSRKTGEGWTPKCIRALWKFLFQLWEGRNGYLHETDRANELAGKDKLIEAVEKEWEIGLNRLPPMDYSYMFRMKREVLLQKSMEYLKDWLFIIRTSRKVHKDPEWINDEFSKETALKKWIEIQDG